MKFDVRYYLVAIAFIIFDLEVAYMFPWAAIYQEFVAVENSAVRSFGFIEMFIFMGILIVGFVWAWLKGALDWE
jgi:NADH-quinone oxidoreductase subunit A